jgi:hypothetical protein
MANDRRVNDRRNPLPGWVLVDREPNGTRVYLLPNKAKRGLYDDRDRDWARVQEDLRIAEIVRERNR